MMLINRSNLTKTRVRPGFSLLELMLVLVILGLLSTVAAVALIPQAQKAKVRTTKQSMKVIKNAITQYQLEKSRVPATVVELIPEFLEDGDIRDGWKQDFYYQPTPNGARPYTLMSFGKDMTPDTEDDIDVWTMDIEDPG
jgi:general secretion pathway protein G